MTPTPARRDGARRPEARRPTGRDAAAASRRAATPPESLVFAAIATLAIAALAWNATHWRPFIADDALISLRYADRFLHGHGLTWNDGERVEGYSNLLWVLLCAGLGALGVDLVTAARALGFVFGAGAVAAVAWTFARLPGGGALPALAAAFALALASPIGVWTIGGLEGPLVVFLLALAIALLAPIASAASGATDFATRTGATRTASALLGLLCITRPDGIVLAAGVIAGVVAARGRAPGNGPLVAALALGPFAATAAQLAFRLAYYHEWISNSARVKLGFSWVHARSGALYVLDGVVGFVPLVLVLALGAWASRGDARRAESAASGFGRMLLVAALVFFVYLVAIGGDFFPGRRFLLPLIVVLAFATGLAVRTLRARWPAPVAIGVVAALLAGYAALQFGDPAAVRAKNERWEWEGREVGRFLARAFGDRKPWVAVDPAGSVPFWSRLPAIDMLGLSDSYLAHHPPAGFGSGKTGHELGDGRYVLSREPDFVILCLPAGRDTGCFKSGKELVADPEFQRRYALANYLTDGAEPVLSRIWTRREGGAVGIRRGADRIEIQGWQLSGNPGTVIRWDEGAGVGALVDPVTPAVVELEVPAGAWSAIARSDPPGARVRVRSIDSRSHVTPTSAVVATGIDSVRLESTGGTYEIAIGSEHPARVREIVLTREGGR